MKYLYNAVAFTVVCFLCSAGLRAQTLPTIGEIYDYAVGDSFLHKMTDLTFGPVVRYESRAILSRDDNHFPDSLVYRIQITVLDSNRLNPVIVDTVLQVYYKCNNPIFPPNGFIHCYNGFQGDSCGYDSVSITTDSLFPGLTVYRANFGCGWWDHGWNSAAVGLGIVHAWLGCGDFLLQAYDIVLVDYYKNTTGVSNLTNNKLQISPNPAANTVTISVDEQLIGSTITVSDIIGRKKTAVELTTVNGQLTTENFANGVYFVTVADKQGRCSTKKLVVSK